MAEAEGDNASGIIPPDMLPPEGSSIFSLVLAGCSICSLKWCPKTKIFALVTFQLILTHSVVEFYRYALRKDYPVLTAIHTYTGVFTQTCAIPLIASELFFHFNMHICLCYAQLSTVVIPTVLLIFEREQDNPWSEFFANANILSLMYLGCTQKTFWPIPLSLWCIVLRERPINVNLFALRLCFFNYFAIRSIVG